MVLFCLAATWQWFDGDLLWFWIERLPCRISSVGQGNPISPQEMRETLLLDADKAILAVGSVCHTAGANIKIQQAYCTIAVC